MTDAAGFAGRCGPASCSTPLRTPPLGDARGLDYRGPWRLPGPDLHRLAALSLSPVTGTAKIRRKGSVDQGAGAFAGAEPGHGHINLHGRYYFTPSNAVARGELCSLRSVGP
jgi:hypothetical protein